jgi:hypothetical protein
MLSGRLEDGLEDWLLSLSVSRLFTNSIGRPGVGLGAQWLIWRPQDKSRQLSTMHELDWSSRSLSLRDRAWLPRKFEFRTEKKGLETDERIDPFQPSKHTFNVSSRAYETQQLSSLHRPMAPHPMFSTKSEILTQLNLLPELSLVQSC